MKPVFFDKNILVLGCNGFIGQNLAEMLTRLGANVSGCDLHNQSVIEISNYFKAQDLQVHQMSRMWSKQYDFCINAIGGSVPSSSISKPLIDFEVNATIELYILHAIKETQDTCKHIFISSAAIYGDTSEQCIEFKPTSPYGWNKKIGELLCQEYSELFGIETMVIRPFSIYGPGLRKQIFWDLCKKSSLGGEIEVHGKGDETRDYVYIDDMVNAIIHLMQKTWNSYNVLDIGSTEHTSIREVCELIAHEFEKLADDLVFNQKVFPGSPKSLVSKRKSELLQDFEFKTSLSLGVQKTVAWFKEVHRS